MNFHEKSAWACLVAILVAFGPYFVIGYREPMATIGLLIGAVVVLVLLLTGFHIVNALATRSIRQQGDTPLPDELDRLIELRAAKLSGIVLAIVVVAWSLGAMLFFPALAGEASFIVPIPQVLAAVHLLFGGFVLANLAYYAAIVTSYRKAVYG